MSIFNNLQAVRTMTMRHVIIEAGTTKEKNLDWDCVDSQHNKRSLDEEQSGLEVGFHWDGTDPVSLVSYARGGIWL